MARAAHVFIIVLVVLGVFSVHAQEDSLSQEEILQIDTAMVMEENADEYEPGMAQILPDTVSVQPRHFDEATLEEIRRDKDFDYHQTPTVGESLWDRFWRWVSQMFREIIRGAVGTNWGRVFLYAGCLVVLVMIVMALLKVDAFKVLFKGADVASVKGVFHEDIHAMDFDTLINEAVHKKDFRNAVRLIFLYSLKLLSDGQHIHWQAGKTNHDYLQELKSAELKTGLGELSFYFDYAWYGGFSVSEGQFARVRNIFDHWRGAVK
jgi:uncharacterized protein DUF4129